ncbi:hypothetical protein QO034_11340 [Sedimentitalea sp. JM2-8]|uniref:Uncharacterized protein n=1 Tax=Sedimentitalea xiamensis TaxID=3050037 RepID=A0ABT7FF46_9RHOB|nr:hypothetical protein [Sedimentitalea xiamensis]
MAGRACEIRPFSLNQQAPAGFWITTDLRTSDADALADIETVSLDDRFLIA